MITLSRTGQVGKFLSKYAPNGWPTTLCDVVTAVLWRASMLMVAGVFIGIYFIGLVEFCVYGWSYLILIPATVSGVVFFITNLVGGCLLLVGGFFVLMTRTSVGAVVDKTCEVTSEVYDGIKDRYCPLVQFEERD